MLPEELDGWFFTGAHSRAGVVAVGDWTTAEQCDGPDGCRPVAAAWWSDHAGRWHRVPDDPSVFGHARMEHVWERPDGYTALGHLVAADGQAEAPMVWRSPDGRHWHRQPPVGPAPLEAWPAVAANRPRRSLLP